MAFSDDWRGGNPAAVCPLAGWLPDHELQAIAEANNLSETAFVLVEPGGGVQTHYPLRWFTPLTEVDLCGHATLATAHVLYRHLGVSTDRPVSFLTRSGRLSAMCVPSGLTIELPASDPKPLDGHPDWVSALGKARPQGVWVAEDYLVLYETEHEVRGLSPDYAALAMLDRRGVIVTARADEMSEYDFVSRFFVPKLGVNEDPVTGSAHCQLLPFWSRAMQRRQLTGWQASNRGGRVMGECLETSVRLTGRASTFSIAEMML